MLQLYIGSEELTPLFAVLRELPENPGDARMRRMSQKYSPVPHRERVDAPELILGRMEPTGSPTTFRSYAG
jgi:hypothetical protein